MSGAGIAVGVTTCDPCRPSLPTVDATRKSVTAAEAQPRGERYRISPLLRQRASYPTTSA